MKITKLRDGVDGGTFTFRLLPVDLGPHPDPAAEPGERWGSCVVVAVDDAIAAPALKPKRLAAGPTVALDALRRAIDTAGEPIPATSAIPAGVKAVRTEVWQCAYNALRPLADGAAGDDSRRDANARRTAFRRAQEVLQAARVVGTHAGMWWVA
jgi:hypothetical protein